MRNQTMMKAILAGALTCSCAGNHGVSPSSEDLLFEPPAELFDSPLTSAPAAFSVRPSIETPSLFDDESGGSANGDDPAIWVHPTAPDKSLIIVTKKEAGLSVYDLRGNEVQSIDPPPPRNADD